MDNKVYKIAILGSGPIGASTAYHLPDELKQESVLITQDPTDDYTATYTQAGGSLRWYWDDEEKTKATKMTADFIKQRVADGIDLGVLEDHYLFVNKGVYVPSLNVAGKKLINYLLDEAEQAGLMIQKQAKIQQVEAESDKYRIVTSQGEFLAEKVVLCLGCENRQFLFDPEFETEKRQLFVMDVEVDQDRQSYPHLILPVAGGVVYNFIKETDSGLKMLVGQEDIIEHNDKPEPEDYFQELLDKGLAEVMPYLKEAKVGKILWGFDAKNKLPKIYTQDDKLFSVNCGSAVRSAIYIGQKVVEKITANV